jgi:ankyrin repeat protein
MLEKAEEAGQALSPDDAFYDLGSGLGKMILQIHLTTDAGSAIGVELAPERYKIAMEGLRQMREALPEAEGSPHIGFVEEDIRNSGIWSNATVVYMPSLCFGPELMLEVMREMSQTLQPGTLVYSLKPLPGCHADAKFLDTILVPMSWQFKSEVNVYIVPPWQSLPVPLLQLDEKEWKAGMEAELGALEKELAPDGGTVPAADFAEKLRAKWGMSQLSPVVRALGTSKGVVKQTSCAAGGKPLQGAEAAVMELRKAAMHRARALEMSAVKCAWLDLEASFLANGEDGLVDWLTNQTEGESSERPAAAASDSRGDTLLHSVCTAIAAKREGLVPATIGQLAERNADLDARGFRQLTPLQVAAEEGSKEAVEALLDAGAKVDGPDDDGPPPLHGAARNGHWEIAQLLLDNGADASASGGALFVSTHRGQTEVTKMLLDNRAEANGKNADGRTPLAFAAEEGHESVMELLIERGAAIDDLDEMTGSSALHLAVERGRIEASEVLLTARAEVDIRDSEGQTPLHKLRRKAYKDVRTQMVPLLLKHGADIDALDKVNSSLLMSAAVRGDEELMPLLIASKASLEQTDPSGATPAHMAAARNRDEALELLIKAKASINTVDRSGGSPMGEAAAQGLTGIMKILLKAGASADSPSVGGDPAIYGAAKWGHVPAMELLLKAGASTTTPSKKKSEAEEDDVPGKPLLHVAMEQGREDIARLLLEQGMSADVLDHQQRTPLHRAAEHASGDLADFLLEKKAAVESKDDEGLTPLHVAATKASSQVISRLLKANGSVDVRDKRGRTPLSHAAGRGHVVVVQELVAAGAAKDSADESGSTPWKYAQDAGHVELKSILGA